MALYRTNVALSVKGDRIERGSEIELSAAEAANLDPADITLVSRIPAPEPEAPAEDVAVEDMSLPQLKARAKEIGLATSGSKADLIERITLNSGAETPAEEETEDEITSE